MLREGYSGNGRANAVFTHVYKIWMNGSSVVRGGGMMLHVASFLFLFSFFFFLSFFQEMI